MAFFLRNVFSLAALSAAVLAAGAGMSAHADDSNYGDISSLTASGEALGKGYVYIHTSRDKNGSKKNGDSVSGKGRLVPAEGFSAKNEKGGCITLVLSNGTVIFANDSADFTIDKFDQTQPFKMSMSDEMEVSPSMLSITLRSGKIFVSGKYPRPASRTRINMKFGVFEPQSSAYIATATERSSQLDLIEGQTRFTAVNGKTDFFQQGQSGTATADSLNGNYPLLTNPINDMDKDTINNVLSTARTAGKSVYFQFSNDGKLNARRVVPKEFFLKKPKYDFRPY